jgi:hypothetical protein
VAEASPKLQKYWKGAVPPVEALASKVHSDFAQLAVKLAKGGAGAGAGPGVVSGAVGVVSTGAGGRGAAFPRTNPV